MAAGCKVNQPAAKWMCKLWATLRSWYHLFTLICVVAINLLRCQHTCTLLLLVFILFSLLCSREGRVQYPATVKRPTNDWKCPQISASSLKLTSNFWAHIPRRDWTCREVVSACRPMSAQLLVLDTVTVRTTRNLHREESMQILHNRAVCVRARPRATCSGEVTVIGFSICHWMAGR